MEMGKNALSHNVKECDKKKNEDLYQKLMGSILVQDPSPVWV